MKSRATSGILATVGALALLVATPSANHSWGNYHWARTSNPFTLKVGDNVSATWDAMLNTTVADWSQSQVLDLVKVAGRSNPRNCRPTAGQVEVCNSTYGNNGWLGIAQIWASGSHITQGVTKLNLGDQKWQQELIYYFLLALASGVLLVFAVLVLLYRRFLSPFVNMGSLILAPLGAVIALHVAGQPLSLPVLIGILMLFGIVAKNSILLVDFAVEMMNHGMEKDEAIYEAGHKRAQPIVMTTVAMVAGMLPTAMSISGDNSWRQPMGITVIGGLIFSTLLTLVLVPSYFSIAISIESRIGKLFHRFIGSDAHASGHPVPAE